MDGLKRAERAREAKEREGGGESQPPSASLSLDALDADKLGAGFELEPIPDASTDGLELGSPDPLDDTGPQETVLASAAEPPSPAVESEPDLSDSMALAVEDLAVEDDPSLEDDHLDDSGLDDATGPQSSVDDASDIELPPIYLGTGDGQVEDVSATLPSLKAARASVDSYFDGTDSISISMTPVTPESYADTASSNKGKRLGEEVEAQLAAQRVFDSKPPKMPSSGRGSQFVSFVLLPLLLVFGGGAGFWYWFETTQSSSVVGRGGQPSGFVDTVIDFFVPQQSIVATPPPPRTPPVTPQPAARSASVGSLASVAAGGGQQASTAEILARAQQRQQAEVEAQTRAKALLQAGSEALRAEGEKPLDPATPVPQEGNLSVQPPEPKVVEAPPSSAVPPTQSEPVQSELAQPEPSLSDNEFEQAVARTERNLPSAPPTRGTLNISKQEAQSETSRVLNRAYSAVGRGEFAAASRGYEAVLRLQPSNRNAILGAAAAAANTGNIAKATALYRAALELNPKDTLARAALAGLAANSDPSTNESELKHLIAAEPSASHLHYSLGNLYAEQERWPEAQAAYFEAVRFDGQNPDYAFNLAVSLDHMRQASAALDYYRRSLELARSRSPGFDVGQAQLRIAAMAGNP